MAGFEIWSDLHDEIKSDGVGNLKKVVNQESVKTSIRNILGTRKGERVMLPEFGSSLDRMVFEAATPALLERASLVIKRDIETWDPRVEVSKISFMSDPDRSFIDLVMNFRIKGYDEVFVITENMI